MLRTIHNGPASGLIIAKPGVTQNGAGLSIGNLRIRASAKKWPPSVTIRIRTPATINNHFPSFSEL